MSWVHQSSEEGERDQLARRLEPCENNCGWMDQLQEDYRREAEWCDRLQ